MLLDYFLPLAQSLFLYLCLTVSFLGWGSVAAGLMRIKDHSALSGIWMGWAVSVFIWQILHFFFPIHIWVVLPVLVLGGVFSLRAMPKLFIFRFHNWREWIMAGAVAFFFLALMVWCAKLSTGIPTNPDSGLYHFTLIRWTNSFPLVPGLGNLHDRLAFNQSFFTYAAALNFYPYFNLGRTIANSYLMILALATCLVQLFPVLQNPRLVMKAHPFAFLPAFFLLPFLGYLLSTSNGLASPSPDLTSSLLQLVMFIIFAQIVADWMEGHRAVSFDLVLLNVLAATAITIKLSNLVYAVTLVLLSLFIAARSSAKKSSEWLRILLLPGLILVVMALRGYVLSGAPFFPATVGFIPFPWAVPREKAVDTANWIYSWARQPDVHWSQVLGKWDWFGPWLSRIRGMINEIVYPFGLAAGMGVITLVVRRWIKAARLHLLEWLTAAPVLASLAYWFLTAPEPRFASALFFLLAESVVCIFLLSVRKFLKPALYAAVILFVFLLTHGRYLSYTLHHTSAFQALLAGGYRAVPVSAWTPRVTRSGLIVNTPTQDDSCWDAPLPCSPYFQPDLALRRSGDLGSGFVGGSELQTR